MKEFIGSLIFMLFNKAFNGFDIIELKIKVNFKFENLLVFYNIPLTLKFPATNNNISCIENT